MEKKILRKFGFYKDQEGIVNRYLREADKWELHLTRTRDFILKSAAARNKSKAAILGSGWMLDVPYRQLSEIFEEVVFIDIRHPRQIVHRLKKYTNLKCLECDISGFVVPVYQLLKLNKKNSTKLVLSELQAEFPVFFTDLISQADFVVSVNLLNQLDILICDYIAKTKQYINNEISVLRKKIQQCHLDILPKHKSILITDYEELNLNGQDHVVNRRSLVHVEIPENLIREKWKWEFDTKKTFHSDFKTVFKVMAVEL